MKTKDIIKIGKGKFRDRFDYSMLIENEYSRQDKVTVICKKHGTIETTVYDHLRSRTRFGCRKCSFEKTKSTYKEITERYINKSKDKHQNKFTYILHEDSVDIICPIHGLMENADIFNHHNSLTGCKLCGIIEQGKTSIKIPTKEELLILLNSVHNGAYKYDLSNYRTQDDYIVVFCKEHGSYSTKVRNILNNKSLCKQCSYNNKKLKFSEFVERSKVIHGDNYEYYWYHYTKSIDVTKIKHKLCNKSFWRKARKHLEGQYCPMCKYSKGESKVMDVLIKHKIEYKREHRLPNSNKPFDFYLPKLNILIEYDGEQHFKEIKGWGGAERLEKQIESDKIKDSLAKDNGVDLIRIHFKDYNIVEKVLMEKINNLYPFKIGNVYYKNLPM